MIKNAFRAVQVGHLSGEDVGPGPRGSLWAMEERPAFIPGETAERSGPLGGCRLPVPRTRRGQPARLHAARHLGAGGAAPGGGTAEPQPRPIAPEPPLPARRLVAAHGGPWPGWPLLVEARPVVVATPERISAPRNNLLCPVSGTGQHVITSPMHSGPSTHPETWAAVTDCHLQRQLGG